MFLARRTPKRWIKRTWRHRFSWVSRSGPGTDMGPDSERTLSIVGVSNRKRLRSWTREATETRVEEEMGATGIITRRW